MATEEVPLSCSSNISAYMNLLQQYATNNIGLRIVSTQFFEILSNVGWEKVSTWLRATGLDTGLDEGGWHTAELLFLVIFMGESS